MRYNIEVEQNADILEGADTIERAREIVTIFENQDKKEGNFEENYYAIRDTETDEIIY